MTTTLVTVLEHARKERDLVLAALRRAEEQERRLRAQAEQLVTYRGEYQQRWSAQFSRSGTSEIVQCYRSFMERLDEANHQQHGMASSAGAQCQELRERVLAAETRVASVQKLIERRSLEHRRAQSAREQRQTDESAQQRPRQRLGDTVSAPL